MIFNPKYLEKINLPNGWKFELLGNYSNIVTSFKTFQKIKDEYEKNIDGLPIHYLKVSDMNLEGNKIFFLNSNNSFYSGAKKNFDKGFLKPNSLVFPKRGAAIATNKKRITSTYSVLDPNLIGVEPNDKIEISFLYLFFKLFDLKWLQDNNVIPQLNKHNVAGVKFPLPPLPEQRKIAYVLSTVQKPIEQQDKLIRHTTELKKALMQKLFTEGTKGEKQKQTEIGLVPESWEVQPFENTGDVVYGIQAAVASNLKPIGHRILTNKNITIDGKIILEKINYFKLTSKKHFDTILQKGDLLFNWRSGSKEHVGKTAIFDLEDSEYVHSSFILRIRVNKNHNAKFLFFYLNYLREIGYYQKVQTFSINAKFNKSAINAMPIALPKKNIQDLIANAIEAVDTKIDNQIANSNLKNILFKTLLHELMTGERRVHEIEFENQLAAV
jgi:type I restriction enzyme S subunit